MRSLLSISSLFLLLLFSASSPALAQQNELRVCADPNNLPFSNKAQQGFENKIADLLAQRLNAKLSYTWARQGHLFIRQTLFSRACDVVLGLPIGFPKVLTTQPYYASTWVFVSRKDKQPPIRSFDDPRLRRLKIGLHKITDDQDTPAYSVLKDRGLEHNIVWFAINQDYSRANPPAELIEAVESGKVEVAIAWGPLAGFFARKSAVPLQITPVSQPSDARDVPFTFSIAMAVRRDEPALKQQLENALIASRPEIQRILSDYGVPRVPPHAAAARRSGD